MNADFSNKIFSINVNENIITCIMACGQKGNLKPSALVEYFSSFETFELDKIKTFIDSYYESDTQNKERELPYIKSIALKWIDYLLTKNSFDTSTKESFEVKKKLIEEYL